MSIEKNRMRYFYYRLWQLFIRIKTNDMPATNAMIFITLWQFLNLSLIYILLGYFFRLEMVLRTKKEIYLIVGIFYSALTILNYFFLYKKREKLREKYMNESRKQIIIGNVLLIFYVLGSLAFIFYFGPKHRKNYYELNKYGA